MAWAADWAVIVVTELLDAENGAFQSNSSSASITQITFGDDDSENGTMSSAETGNITERESPAELTDAIPQASSRWP